MRFLVGDGWLATLPDDAPATASCRRRRRMLDQPFWLDPRDPHRLRSAVQVLTQPHVWLALRPRSGRSRRALEREGQFYGLSTAVHRVVADGLTPEQAADEAIARVKQLLGE